MNRRAFAAFAGSKEGPFTDFTNYPTGSSPAGWSMHWNSNNTDIDVVAGGVYGGQRVFFDTDGTTAGRFSFVWDGVWNNPNDVEITAIFDEIAYHDNSTRFGPLYMVSGSPGSETGVFLIQNVGRNIRVGQYDAGAFNDVQVPVPAYSNVITAYSLWQYTMRVSGDLVLGKMDRSLDGTTFEDREGWDIVTTTTVSGGSEVGIYNFNAVDFYCDQFAVDEGGPIQEIVVCSSTKNGYYATAPFENLIVDMDPPENIQEDDLLILTVMERHGMATPSGWTLIDTAFCGSANQNTRCYWQRVGAGGSANGVSFTAFTPTGGSYRWAGQITAFRSTVAGKRPVVGVSSKRQSASVHGLPSLTVGSAATRPMVLLADTCTTADTSIATEFFPADVARSYSWQGVFANRLNVSANYVTANGSFTATRGSNIHGITPHNCSQIAVEITLENTP